MQASNETVLLLTHTDDHYTVDRVADALRKRGACPVRIDTDLFPTTLRLVARLNEMAAGHRILVDDLEVCGSDVRAVWNRKLRVPQLDDRLDPRFRAGCLRESQAAFDAFLDGLHAARWVNHLEDNRAASNKARQLRHAHAVGLRVPHTLITNDPEEVRAFHAEQDGAIVTKMLTALSSSMGKASFSVRTSDVRREDLSNLESLRHCPMVFQERIPKDRELRVVFVAGEVFVGSIDASRSKDGQTDWRSATPGECSWHVDELPQATVERIQSLMAALDLVYGAIDLIRTPDGAYVFLEVNPSGEWGMLERDIGVPISDALAEALLT